MCSSFIKFIKQVGGGGGGERDKMQGLQNSLLLFTSTINSIIQEHKC